ncbi:MAG: FUSC family protein [bacterium]|nr:FUSC family protein [bacterium]
MIDKLKQLFFYEKTFYITIIGTLVLLPVNTFFHFFIQEIALLPFCLFFAGFALSIGVLTAYIRGDLINLNGLVVALIMYLFFRYGLSVEYLMSYDSETILNYGLAGCLIISSFLYYNYNGCKSFFNEYICGE